MRKNVAEIFQTDIYGVTCESLSACKDNLEVVRRMIDAGVKIIQYREKDKTKREKYEECRVIREMCKPAGVLFIVNDDVDIAILSKAGGVHVGPDDLPANAVRKLVGEEMIIGVSADTPADVEDAMVRGADYVGVGPVFKTGTKADAGEPVGLDLIEHIAKNYKIPLVAIGGINGENIVDVRRRGVPCSAMVSALVSCADVEAEVKKIRQLIAESGC
ncbi:thiamine phosphate synthase [Dethiobacter alkaliphilus]|uniref:Thiamine-phosphate synthase n=1 Tax=Dethiobacter alkaliphilus AHT 1 TaxID=555088 RepID=C0GKK2_DETAL|nr:thiamine phosphate synthase [Dethiobacter alkaliphilus]EEG76169.1 thiamine-phosphate pyrophosphorylase [Dethiobacter alkaliphilus AHT 1]